MSEAVQQKIQPYRWVVLFAACVVHAALNFTILQIAGLGARIIPEFKLTSGQFAMITTVPFLTGAIFGIPSGSLADRYGVKNVLTIGLIISVISSIARIWVDQFALFFVLNFLIGFALAALNANSPKILGAWFPATQMSTAMGLYVASATVGTSIAIATAALFSSIQSALTASALIILAALIIWVIFAKSKPEGAPEPPVQPVTKYIGEVVKSKYLWLVSLQMFVILGACITENSFMSVAFTQGKGADPVFAGLATSIVNIAVLSGSVLVPLISDRFGLIKPFMLGSAVISAILVFIAWNIPFGVLSVVVFVIQGILTGGLIPLCKALPALLPDIKPDYVGSAGGVQSTLQNVGAFLVPSYIIAPIAGSNMNIIFMGVAITFMLVGLLCIPMPEWGAKARK